MHLAEIKSPSGLSFDEAKVLRHKARLTGMNPNYWYPAAWSKDLKRGQVIETKFWKQSIALFRGEDDGVAALENRCLHRHIPLTMGHVRGCDLVCIYHGWKYDANGKLIAMDHDLFGRNIPNMKVRSYPVRERYGVVWIFPGHPELAAATPLVEIPHGEGPDRWAPVCFDYTWKAHHSMVIDNLCNLTHLYVHGKWVPYDKTHLAHSGLEEERLTLTWSHTLRRDIGWPIYKSVFLKAGTENLSDTDMIYDYPYQSAYTNHKIRSCNFLLPIDESTTKVFTMQLWRRPNLPLAQTRLGAALMERVFAPLVRPVTMEIFRQDGATVEAEQARLDDHFFDPIPELNHSVRLFDRLNVDRWAAWLDSERQKKPALGAATTRVKVL